MVSFARATTKSWLLRLWPLTFQPIKKETAELDNSKNLLDKQLEQNKCFLEANKNGGMWLS